MCDVIYNSCSDLHTQWQEAILMHFIQYSIYTINGFKQHDYKVLCKLIVNMLLTMKMKENGISDSDIIDVEHVFTQY